MTTKEQRDLANWILEQVGTANPYRRSRENRKSEFYIYQGGYLAGYLASLMLEDPFIAHRFKRHVAKKQQLK